MSSANGRPVKNCVAGVGEGSVTCGHYQNEAIA